MSSLPENTAEVSRRAMSAAGFANPTRAKSLLASRELEGLDLEALVTALAHAADSDHAVLLWVRLIERADQARTLLADPEAALTLTRLLGASEALGEFLIRRPENLDLIAAPHRAEATAPALGLIGTDADWPDSADTLRRLLLEAVDADPEAPAPHTRLDPDEAVIALRRAYRRQLTAIALADLAAADAADVQPSVAAWLADLAGAALHAGLAVSRTRVRERLGAAVDHVRLAVIGMGKCGARELNYISDVDVIYVHGLAPIEQAEGATDTEQPDAQEPPTDTEEPPSDTEAAVIAAELASGMAKVIYGSAAEPALWEVDANLRPEGKDGALSRTVDSHREYYRRWAHGWEFQALLKARPIAGDAELGQRYIEAMWPLVWESSAREGFVEQVQQMRARVMDTLSHTERDREIKLGAGGLRDVEFTAQLLQLVHGRADESVRVRSTLEAITALQQATYISTADATAFAGHYRWLRALEHRIQLVHLRRTHLMPAKEAAQRVIARSLRGAGDTATATGEDLTAAFRRVRREVRHLHERIFYRPLLSTTAALSAGEVKLTAEAVQARLSALGYRDPRGALRHIESLTQGVSRRAAMQRQLLPVMLGWFANGTDPDRGLLAFRRLSESLGQSSWFLRMLRDSDAAAQRLCRVLSTSRFIGDQLEHSPESAAWFGDDKQLAPVDTAALWSQLSARLSRRTQAESAAQVIRHVRQVRRREVLRIAVADALGRLDIQQIGQALADIDTVAVVGALQTCLREIEREEELITDLAVIAMGRQGGREITYGSDADVMYVHRPHAGADPDAAHEQAVRLAKQVAAVLRQPPQPPLPGERPLEMDADLRPEGRQGPLARTLDSYQEYYRRWAEVWERQALLRARVVAGESTLCREVTDWVDSVRYGGGLNSAEVREIRRIKARVEAERLPRGADPNRHVKLGRGGLSDVEWLVQSLQLRHADEISALRTTATLPALRALASHEILPSRDAEALETAWLLATRIRAASFLWSGKTSDVLPSSARDLQGLARWCAPEATTAADFEAHYLRVTRHARHVFEAHFYGLD